MSEELDQYGIPMDPLGDTILTFTNSLPAATIPSEVRGDTRLSKKARLSSPTDSDPKPELVPEHKSAAPEPGPAPERTTTTFLVSSRHLSLASHAFKEDLTEVPGPPEKKPYRLDVTGPWDAKAFAIVMSIIHGRNRGDQVPRKISPYMLSDITLIAYQYTLIAAMEFHVAAWFTAFDRPNLTPWGALESPDLERWVPELLCWLAICLVFPRQHQKELELAVKFLVLHSKQPIKTPTKLQGIIGEDVIKINAGREEITSDISRQMFGVRQKYLHGGLGCGYLCRCLHIDAFTWRLLGLDLVNPAKFAELSVWDVWYNARVDPGWITKGGFKHQCGKTPPYNDQNSPFSKALARANPNSTCMLKELGIEGLAGSGKTGDESTGDPSPEPASPQTT